jgi:prepilin-type N-terminal cleavage/methylation domain-containing protein
VRRRGARSRVGFTLIELMVAVGMMAVIMSISIPYLYHNMHQDSMRKAVSDVMEACSTARARAILDNVPMDLRIRPADRVFSVGPAGGQSGDEPGGIGIGLPARVDYKWGDRMIGRPASGATGGGGPGFQVTLSPSIRVEGLGINGEDWTQDEEGRVRFYPNGTCEEMSLVLRSDKGELRNVWLEVVTAFADLEADPFKFKDR